MRWLKEGGEGGRGEDRPIIAAHISFSITCICIVENHTTPPPTSFHHVQFVQMELLQSVDSSKESFGIIM